MAKELPYFRFYVSEWMNDDISMESKEVKGVFSDVISYYWFRDCNMTLEMLEKKFKHNLEEINQLIDIGVIKIITDENKDMVGITFLDEQFGLLSKTSDQNAKSGALGGKKKAQNYRDAIANAKNNPSERHSERSSYKDKDKDNNKDKERNLSVFNNMEGRIFKSQDVSGMYQQYCKERKKPLSIIIEEVLLKNLKKLSNDNPALAIKIIQKSLVGGYPDFYELTNKDNPQDGKIKMPDGSYKTYEEM